MKEWIAKYQKAIVGTGAVSVLLICFLQQRELSKLRAEQRMEVIVSGDIEKAHTIDSLQSELFVQQTIVGRYEVALELFKEANPKGADQFQLIMSTQTE